MGGYDTRAMLHGVVVVVGGGIVGSSIGYGLSKLGLKIAILDGDDSSFRASAGTFGLVWVQGKGGKLVSYAKWALLASKLFKIRLFIFKLVIMSFVGIVPFL